MEFALRPHDRLQYAFVGFGSPASRWRCRSPEQPRSDPDGSSTRRQLRWPGRRGSGHLRGAATSTVASRSATWIRMRFHPPGVGSVPSGSACPPAWVPGTLSSSRRSPRYSIANTGFGRSSSSKPSMLAVEVDRGIHVADEIANRGRRAALRLVDRLHAPQQGLGELRPRLHGHDRQSQRVERISGHGGVPLRTGGATRRASAPGASRCRGRFARDARPRRRPGARRDSAA